MSDTQKSLKSFIDSGGDLQHLGKAHVDAMKVLEHNRTRDLWSRFRAGIIALVTGYVMESKVISTSMSLRVYMARQDGGYSALTNG